MTTVIVILGLIAAILGAVVWLAKQSRRDGVEAAENKQREGALDAVKERKEIENRVGGLPDDDARKRLREWSRDR